MDGVINQQSGKLHGILNGIDMALYDPAAMPGLAANFTPAAPAKGKTACKLALQRKLGLREDESAPIIACVSRLVGHKGFSLVTDVLHQDVYKRQRYSWAEWSQLKSAVMPALWRPRQASLSL